jgi:hypothetical protein
VLAHAAWLSRKYTTLDILARFFFWGLFIPIQFAAIANEKAAIFFPTPFGPVKSSAFGIIPFCKRVERNRIEVPD